GIIPLDSFHVPHNLAQYMRNKQHLFEMRIDHDFAGTMRECMRCRSGNTWISEPLIAAYVKLHELGFAHSVEVWKDHQIVGGLYGVSIGGAFFGESMFHKERDASKIALVHLVNRLRDRGFELLDSQASTPHLRSFGCIDISADEYLKRLERAVR